MIYQPYEPHQLTEEQKAVIDSNARAFWADFKMRLKGNEIEFYVDTTFGERYCKSMGVFDNPNAVLQSFLDYPGYVNRSPVSAKSIVTSEMLKLGLTP